MTYQALGYWGVDLTAHDYDDIGFTTSPYQRWVQENWDSHQVYLFRFEVSGLPSKIETAAVPYELIKAYVAAMPTGNKNQDIRGITLKPHGSGGAQLAEIVFTDAGGIHLNSDRAGTTLEKMNASLRSSRPEVEVSRGRYAAIVSDDKAISAFWFSKPILWSSARFDAAGGFDLGLGYTEAFYKNRRGVYLNSSTAKPQYELPAYEPPPIAPPGPKPPGGGGVVTLEPVVIEVDGSPSVWPLVLVGAAAAFAVYKLYGQRGSG